MIVKRWLIAAWTIIQGGVVCSHFIHPNPSVLCPLLRPLLSQVSAKVGVGVR
jgi:hypothetical protein